MLNGQRARGAPNSTFNIRHSTFNIPDFRAAARASGLLEPPNLGQVSVVVAAHLVEGGAAELLAHGAGENDGQHGLAHNAAGRYGGDVAALPLRAVRLARLDVDGRQAATQRRDRLSEGAHDGVLTVRHASLQPARPVRSAVVAARP